MTRSKECPRCGKDIGDSYQGEEPDVGIGAGWYCDPCDLAVGDEDGPEPYDDDVQIFGTGGKVHLVRSEVCEHCRTPLEIGYGLAGGEIGPYMFCPNQYCEKPTLIKSQDPE